MNISDLLKGEGLKFLKWVEIITDENQAVKTSAMYILQKDLELCDIIFVSDKGKKRKIKSITIPFLETIFTKLDASNIEGDNIENWRDKLSIYSKSEIEQITMLISEFVNNGKIRADKIESLGLTEIIPTTESTINNFILNYNDFEFQKNDIIGILTSQNPDEYSLYIFIGGDKSLLNNYLPTGLTKITVGMVEGLNDLLNDRYTKSQSDSLYMALADYIVGGKIRADKIEALGLTTLIEVSQTSLASFAANSANYVFEQNDIIAIPDGTGNFALFIFKGGTKTVTSNYLPTGLTNITIAMVSGLQTALDSKVQKPAGTGVFIASQSGATTTWVQISPASYYLNYWDGSNFRASVLYQNGTKLGIGTQTPSEMLHLYDGRIRAKALVLDVNSETLPNQITTNGTRFSGTSSGGTKKPLMYVEYADLLAITSGMTDAQKTEWKTAMNGGWTTNTMSVGLISPPKVDSTINTPTWFLLQGANLNLNPNSFAVDIVDLSGTVIVAVPGSQVSLNNTDGTKLRFYANLNGLANGNYKIRLWNGVSYYTTALSFSISNTLTHIDLSSLVWSKKTYNDNPSSVINASGNSVILKPDSNVKPLADDGNMISSLMSSQFIAAGEDFYIKYTTQVLGTVNPSITSTARTHISLIPTGTVNDLIPKGICKITHDIQSVYSSVGYQYKLVTSLFNGVMFINGTSAIGQDATLEIIIQRVGTLYSINITNVANKATWSFDYSGVSVALCLLVQGTNRSMNYENNINYLEAIKLN